MVPYSLETQVLIVVAIMTIHNYITQEAQRDQLFKKDGNDDLIIIVIDKEDEILVRFMLCHLRWTRSCQSC